MPILYWNQIYKGQINAEGWMNVFDTKDCQCIAPVAIFGSSWIDLNCGSDYRITEVDKSWSPASQPASQKDTARLCHLHNRM